MTLLNGFSAKRMLRPMAAACVFAFAAWRAVAQDLPICPDCGREAASGQTTCPSCGAALPKTDAPAPQPEKADKPDDKAPVSARAAAAADVAEARRVLSSDQALAVILYRNAQALLAAGADEGFDEKAARQLAAELAKAREAFENAFSSSARKAALLRAKPKAEDFFRGSGRTPLGQAWVPLDWPQKLSPVAIAAVRRSIPLQCVACGGSGIDLCKKCGGSGKVRCRNSACKNGWVSRKPTNSLTPKNDIVIRDKCPECRGTTFVACTDCAGRGASACKKCGGGGEAPVCKGCQGTGLEPCRECAKKGVTPDCPTCRGTGSALCRKCGGDGRTPR